MASGVGAPRKVTDSEPISTAASLDRLPDTNGQRATTIFDAVKAGMLIPVQDFVDHVGEQVLSARDEKGHTPVHWACLGGHANILRYMIEMKGPVDEPSNNDLRAHPIHWASTNGHIAVVDILLQAGVSMDVVDGKGCTPLIVAAQYGKTQLAGYLMGKGARLQVTDKDGDNALHWAAFKGQPELMRLLIYSGFNPRQKDNYGQTPLHLACINGNLTAVKELCELDNVEADLPDKNGKTPVMLAIGRKHDDVISFLKQRAKRKTNMLPKCNVWMIVFGPPGNSKGPLLFYLVNLLFWGYPMYIYKAIPLTWADLPWLHYIFIALNIIMWICLYHANSLDPGFLPRNVPEYDMAIKQIAHFDEWKQGSNPLSRLCHTCRTVKPLRSKHCKVCNRCVEHFDHHCPYIYNCVGYNNRVWFWGFVTTVGILCTIAGYFIYHMYVLQGFDWLIVIGSIQAVLYAALGVSLSFMTLVHATMNVTTNERINHKRYDYLKDAKGAFHNPFHRGAKNNLLEYFYLKAPLTESEVENTGVRLV